MTSTRAGLVLVWGAAGAAVAASLLGERDLAIVFAALSLFGILYTIRLGLDATIEDRERELDEDGGREE